MQQEWEETFRKFVETDLAEHGFRLVAPWMAERKAPGVRQGITWKAPVISPEPFGGTPGVSTFWSFEHELDDGPMGCVKPCGPVPVAGVYSGESSTFGGDGDGFARTLRFDVLAQIGRLNRYLAVEQIVKEAGTYRNSRRNLLGTNEIAAQFNWGHCLEVVGRFDDARRAYLKLERVYGADTSDIARAYTSVARRRADALETKPGDSPRRLRWQGEMHSFRSAPELVSLLKFDMPTDSDRVHGEVQQKWFRAILLALREGGVGPSNLVPATVISALESFYTPTRNFWASVQVETVYAALDAYIPDLKECMNADPGGWERFSQSLEQALYARKFDEMCAMRLLELRQRKTRGVTAPVIYRWVAMDLKRRKEFDALAFLERDGERAVGPIVEMVNKLAPKSVERRRKQR